MHADATRFWLVRHGQIEANLTAHWHGSTDSPLTAEGRRQVDRVANWFAHAEHPITAVYSSPLTRTRDTAQGIANALGHLVNPLPELREYCLGEWEGVHYKELTEERRFLERLREDTHWAPPGGESMHGVLERMLQGFHATATRHPGEEVLMVSHGAAMGVLLAHLLEADALGWHSYHLKNCSVSEFWLHPEPGLGLFNQVDHLHD